MDRFRTSWRNDVVDLVLARMDHETKGTVLLVAPEREPRGWVVSITDQEASEPVRPSVCAALSLCDLLAELNEHIRGRLVIGWWSDVQGRLFIDAGLLVPGRAVARRVGDAFAQVNICDLTRSKPRVVAVAATPRSAAGASKGGVLV